MCLPPVSMDIIVNQLMKICEQKQKSWWHKHIGVQNNGFLQCKILPIFKVSLAQFPKNSLTKSFTKSPKNSLKNSPKKSLAKLPNDFKV